jgi:hypothetical protein
MMPLDLVLEVAGMVLSVGVAGRVERGPAAGGGGKLGRVR